MAASEAIDNIMQMLVNVKTSPSVEETLEKENQSSNWEFIQKEMLKNMIVGEDTAPTSRFLKRFFEFDCNSN